MPPIRSSLGWQTVFLRWALYQEGHFGDRLVGLFSMVCKEWGRAAQPDCLFDFTKPSRASRVLSFDVGMVNMGVWSGSQQHELAPYQIHHWEVIDLQTKAPFEGCFNLIQFFFQNRPWFHRTHDRICIESQPRTQASQMQIIAAAIYSYFTTRHFAMSSSEPDLGGLHARVQLVHAGNKLKIDVDHSVMPKPLPPAPASRSARYGWRKRVAIYKTKAFLQTYRGSPAWAEWFSKLKKKDDPADALAQGISVLQDAAKKKKKRFVY